MPWKVVLYFCVSQCNISLCMIDEHSSLSCLSAYYHRVPQVQMRQRSSTTSGKAVGIVRSHPRIIQDDFRSALHNVIIVITITVG